MSNLRGIYIHFFCFFYARKRNLSGIIDRKIKFRINIGLSIALPLGIRHSAISYALIIDMRVTAQNKIND